MFQQFDAGIDGYPAMFSASDKDGTYVLTRGQTVLLGARRGTWLITDWDDS